MIIHIDQWRATLDHDGGSRFSDNLQNVDAEYIECRLAHFNIVSVKKEKLFTVVQLQYSTMYSFSPGDLSPPAQMNHFLHQWNPTNVIPGTFWSSVKFQPLTLNWGHLSVIPLLIEESSHTCWISSLDSRNQQETNRPQAVRTHNNWCNWKSSALPLQSVPALDLKLYCRTFKLHSSHSSVGHHVTQQPPPIQSGKSLSLPLHHFTSSSRCSYKFCIGFIQSQREELDQLLRSSWLKWLWL